MDLLKFVALLFGVGVVTGLLGWWRERRERRRHAKLWRFSNRYTRIRAKRIEWPQRNAYIPQPFHHPDYQKLFQLELTAEEALNTYRGLSSWRSWEDYQKEQRACEASEN